MHPTLVAPRRPVRRHRVAEPFAARLTARLTARLSVRHAERVTARVAEPFAVRAASIALVAVFTALAALTGCVNPPHYEEGHHYRDEPGPYVSLHGLVAVEEFDLGDQERRLEEITGEPASLSTSNSLGAGGRIGYRFGPHVAVEAVGDWYDEYEIDQAGEELAEYDGYSIGANVKGFWPIDPTLHPYALVGAGYLWSRLGDSLGRGIRERDEDWLLRGGLGLEYNLDRWWSLQLEGTYNQPLDDLEDYAFWLFTLGVQYRF